MKISNSSLNLQSQRSYTEIYERRESLTISEKAAEMDEKDVNEKPHHIHNPKDGYDLSHFRGKKKGWEKNGKLNDLQNSQVVSKSDILKDGLEISDIKMRIMKMVLEEVTGEKINIYDPDEDAKESDQNLEIPQVPTEGGLEIMEPQEAREVTIHYELNEIHYEQESLAFEAVGQVNTEDGREISFATSLSQKRELYEENHTEMTTTGTLIDPLVINHDGRGARLTKDKIDFDLTGDGNKESISNLKPGSSFLALDKNGDGEINDGTELFGPSTGNGYAELRELDSDKNGWIDENDELFYDLRLFRPGEESTTLLEQSVGAISVDSVGGSFQIRDDEQNTQGVIREQGIWLNEKTGQAGMVQEIDLMA